MPQIYNEEFRKKIVRLHLQEGRTYKSLYLVRSNNLETMQETRQLRKQLQKLEKENAF